MKNRSVILGFIIILAAVGFLTYCFCTFFLNPKPLKQRNNGNGWTSTDEGTSSSHQSTAISLHNPVKEIPEGSKTKSTISSLSQSLSLNHSPANHHYKKNNTTAHLPSDLTSHNPSADISQIRNWTKQKDWNSLLHFISTDSSPFRYQALRLLGESNSFPLIRLLSLLSQTQDQKIHQYVSDILGEKGNPEIASLLYSTLPNLSTPSSQFAAAKALFQIAKRHSLSTAYQERICVILEELIRKGEYTYSSIQNLKKIGPKGVATLETLAKDSSLSPKIQLQLGEALMEQSKATAKRIFQRLIQNPDKKISEMAKEYFKKVSSY